MLDLHNGDLVIDSVNLSRSEPASELITKLTRAGFGERYRQSLLNLTSVSMADEKAALLLTFNDDVLQHIELQSLAPRLTSWGDIDDNTEAERIAANNLLLGVEAASVGERSWGTVRVGRDPRDTLAKVWIDYT